MTMVGFPLAQDQHDTLGPRDPIECPHCEGSRELEAVTVGDVGGDVADWPAEIERPGVPCFWCLPEYRGDDDEVAD